MAELQRVLEIALTVREVTDRSIATGLGHGRVATAEGFLEIFHWNALLGNDICIRMIQ